MSLKYEPASEPLHMHSEIPTLNLAWTGIGAIQGSKLFPLDVFMMPLCGATPDNLLWQKNEESSLGKL